MAESKDFSFPIPKFDGHYDHWAMLMENLLQSKEFWSIVETGVPVLAANADAEQTRMVNEARLKDLKAKNYLFQAIDRTIIETILDKSSSKAIWDSMKHKFQGSNKVRRAQLQALRGEFEVLRMKEDESVTSYFGRVLATVNKMKIQGETVETRIVVEKILRSMARKFNYVVCAIEESNDVETLSIDELQGSLLVHEQKMKPTKEEDQALKIAHGGGNTSRRRGRGGRSGQGRGKRPGKENIECYKCHKLGHFRYECPEGDDSAYYVDYNDEEEVLLMAFKENQNGSTRSKVWFLDSDERLGRGNVKLHVNGKIQVITSVYYIPELKNNLLSIGQLQMKNLTFVFKNNCCKVYHQSRGLLMTSQMASNKLYPIITEVQESCFQSKIENTSYLWHCRFGHLNYKSLQILKSSAFESFKKFKSLVEKETGEGIGCLRTYRGEFNSTEFKEFCEENDIKRQLIAAYTPQPNGVAERKNRTVMDMVRSMMAGKDIPKEFWPEAVNWAIYVLNRSPTNAIPDKTPEEAWSSIKPTVKHFKIFGCIAYTHIPDAQRKKLDDKSLKCIFLGVSEESKTYRLYHPITKKIIVSRDVKSAESEKWKWHKTDESKGTIQATCEDSDEESADMNQGQEDIDVLEDIQATQTNMPNVEHESTSLPSPSTSNLNQGRTRRPPYWHDDYDTTIDEEELIDEDAMNLVIFGPCVHEDPIKFEEAVKSQTWRTAMNHEIEAIERNNTWELTDLPAGAKVWNRLQRSVCTSCKMGHNQMHISNCSLYVEQPLGYVKKGSESKVYRLNKALYGLKQAPRAWYSKIEQYFVKEGNNNSMVKDFKESMMKTFDMTDLGKMRHFLGIEVIQNEQGIFLCQQRYAKDVLERFNMDKSNVVSSPIVTGTKLSKHDKSEEVNPTQFKQIVGSLMYLTATRPDVMFVVHMIARFMEHPLETHMIAAKRILRYIRDSDYGGDSDDRKSTSGYVFVLGPGAVSWSSRKQPIVTLSTTEAEFIAAAYCVCQGSWLKRILENLGLEQKQCLDVFCDNNSTIKLSKNPVLHGRSKHIDIRFHFLRNLSGEGMIELKHCTSQNQLADIMTKALKLEAFERLRERLGVCSSSDLK
ncbi:hypothetical protein TSUD_200370 [Trifolium subterraneum]|nr:hypothetical protein TSUD_200370 [Trifolium subterraneum]